MTRLGAIKAKVKNKEQLTQRDKVWLLARIDGLASACRVWMSDTPPGGCNCKGCLAVRDTFKTLYK